MARWVSSAPIAPNAAQGTPASTVFGVLLALFAGAAIWLGLWVFAV